MGFSLGWEGKMGSPFHRADGHQHHGELRQPTQAPARDNPLTARSLSVSQCLGSFLVSLMGLLSPQ